MIYGLVVLLEDSFIRRETVYPCAEQKLKKQDCQIDYDELGGFGTLIENIMEDKRC